MERSRSQELTALRVAWDAWQGDPRWPRRYPEPAGGAVGRAGAARAPGFQVLRRSLSRSATGMDRSRGVLPPAAGHQTGADGALR